MGPQDADAAHMRAALELARRGPLVDANPRVGCVLVVGDEVVGRGHHRGAGTPHAEAAALQNAGDRAAGATAYVTLEPCAHHGRTGPCAQALVAAGVQRVVFAQTDPNPDARGGAAHLAAHGVTVERGLLEDAARELNRAWSLAMASGRPMVTWKLASTLDGHAAASDRTSRWVTGPQARTDVHRLRAEVGAVVVGTGTVLADDPSLTVRHDVPVERQPLRVVVGLRPVPEGSRVLDDTAPHLVIAEHDPHQVLKLLWQRQIRHVLLEGGPTLAAAFLRAGVVDEVIAYLAPKLLGDGLPTLGPLGIDTIGEAVELELDEVQQLGQDVRLRLHPRTDEGMV